MISKLKNIFKGKNEVIEGKNVLYIVANPKEEKDSFGLQVGRSFLNEYKSLNPQDEIKEINVFDYDIPLIDKDILSAWESLGSGVEFVNLTKEQQIKVTKFNDLTDEFIEADKYIFVTPMWNLAMPAMMKAYIDTFVVAGKSFKYTENGPVGLLDDKKAIHIYATGGVYSSEGMEYDFGDRYLKSILAFVGIKDTKTIYVEGMAQNPNNAENIKNDAEQKALEIVKEF